MGDRIYEDSSQPLGREKYNVILRVFEKSEIRNVFPLSRDYLRHPREFLAHPRE